MMQAALAVQIAIRDALLAHAGLSGMPVHDGVPQGTAAPYITIAKIESKDWSTKDAKGAEHMVTLHVWSRHAGKAAAYGVLAEIDAALDGAGLTLADHHLVNLSTVFWTVTPEPGDLYRGLVRLRATTEPL
ncbi:DUF3168 domain-containing protein [soil metagenome]